MRCFRFLPVSGRPQDLPQVGTTADTVASSVCLHCHQFFGHESKLTRLGFRTLKRWINHTTVLHSRNSIGDAVLFVFIAVNICTLGLPVFPLFECVLSKPPTKHPPRHCYKKKPSSSCMRELVGADSLLLRG